MSEYPSQTFPFSQAGDTWFRDNFEAATEVQARGWPLIASGQNGLLLAPTGSGKTLAAFLWSLDHLQSNPDLLAQRGFKIVYVSPLKALVYDVERNLRAPLIGLQRTRERLSLESHLINVDIRTGDTSQKDRARMLRDPGDILITTPESLYLMLSSRVREHFAATQLVILDEVHVLAGTKRGAHLAVSLERLSELADQDPQRIGLSATVRPAKAVASFLGGYRPVEIIDTTMPPKIELSVGFRDDLLADETSEREEELASAEVDDDDIELELDDDFDLDEDAPDGSILGALYKKDLPSGRPSHLPTLAPKLLQLIREHQTTIVFVNSRGATERLTQTINELAGEDISLAHHGSMSHERRENVEEALKTGTIDAIVATSSLELGVDMGSVDLVIQLESPGAVSRGLQRIGRAGHGVGETSRGILIPKFKTDMIECACVAKLMQEAKIESIRTMTNPLDVLTQQLVSICGQGERGVDELKALVRQSQPFASISDAAFDGVLEMACGHYPSTEFSDLRPHLDWDRERDVIVPRRSALKISQSNAGTIPDRGLYTVRLGPKGPRLGELDEEMVFEAREGQTFVLGASTWRIEEITRDQVIVSPAPGEPGTLPFWHGSGPGRPYDLGIAIGELLAAVASRPVAERATYLRENYPLESQVAADIATLVNEELEATGLVPTHRQVVVERFMDELGDDRICILAPFGTAVNAPWAMALESMLSKEHGFDVQALWSDDGISLTLVNEGQPLETDIDRWLPDPDEIEDLIIEQLSHTALFAGTFRENAGRALLLPRKYPGKRTPLWAQRLKSQKLLAVAKNYSDFPIVLETYRTCLRDIFDIETLKTLLAKLRDRTLSIREVETDTASPLARSLVFDYVAAWIYEGDAPLAERRAQALTLDRNLLRDLLGHAELRDLLDIEAIEEIYRELQAIEPEHQASHPDALQDLVRRLGDLSSDELSERSTSEALDSLDALAQSRRLIELRITGEPRWVVAQEAGLYRDALGVVPPAGLPSAYLGETERALEQLVSRYARTHTPFTSADVANRFGLRSEQVEPILEGLRAQRLIESGAFLPNGSQREWCTPDILRRIRRRSLAKLRGAVEPVAPAALQRFVLEWQGLGRAKSQQLHEVLLQLEGLALPMSELETKILPARLPNYESRDLDLLTSTGEWVWVGAQSLRRKDGLIQFYRSDRLERLYAAPSAYIPPSELHGLLLRHLSERGASFLFNLRSAAQGHRLEDVTEALWDLVWAGLITNDTLSPLRGLAKGSNAKRRGRRQTSQNAGGRWSLVDSFIFEPASPTERHHHWAQLFLRRYGIVLRDMCKEEPTPIAYGQIYPIFKAMEEVGRVQRGYFIEEIEGIQFAMPGLTDDLRRKPDPNLPPVIVTLSARDPANLYGRVIAWPQTGTSDKAPRREAGASVVLIQGEPALWLSPNAQRLLTFPKVLEQWDESTVSEAAARLIEAHGIKRDVVLEEIDGGAASEHIFANILERLGAKLHPNGLLFSSGLRHAGR